MAFYLKYRPQTISELDLAYVREKLTNALKSKSTPHALLFTGPRGTGKTSSARIVAKAINCESRIQNPESRIQKKISKSEKLETKNLKLETNYEPCNSCPACLSITSGRALDVIEIDAASHRGIDDIRDLREKIKLAPTELKYKVYIIDEVHMLTTEAFNALLKTLEEPPDNVIFILCTTELHKLPQTIISRCVQVPFPKATTDDLTHSLQRVVNGEKLEIQDSALRIIAEHADGSFRDAHKLLEQLSWQLTKNITKITEQQVKQFIGLSENRINQIIPLLIGKKIDQVITLIEEITSQGENLKVIFRQVLQLLHQRLLLIYVESNETKEPKHEKSIENLNELVKLLDKAIYEMKTTTIPQLPLELAILEWGSEARVGLSPLERGPVNLNMKSSNLQGGVPTQPRSSTPTPPSPPPPSAPPINSGVDNSLTLSHLQQNWNNLLNTLKPHNHSLHALLRSAKPQQVDGKKITIEVWYPFHFEKLNSIMSRQIVEQTICDHFQCSTINVEYILSQNQTPIRRPNGKMIAESETGPNFNRPPRPSSPKVSDKPNPAYSPRSAGNYSGSPRRSASPAASEEDDALIKFAEEIFGG